MASEPDRLPVDAARVDMGTSWSPAPTEWRTRSERCVVCTAPFTITAREQRFWYESLRIPMHVSIDRCAACRREARVHRRILGSLDRILPRIDAGLAREDERREAALAVVEGALRQRRLRFGRESRFTTRPVLERGAAIIAGLRRTPRSHDDLIPLQLRLHELLGNHTRVERLRRELAQAWLHGATAEMLRVVESWLSGFGDAQRSRVVERRRR